MSVVRLHLGGLKGVQYGRVLVDSVCIDVYIFTKEKNQVMSALDKANRRDSKYNKRIRTHRDVDLDKKRKERNRSSSINRGRKAKVEILELES